MVVTSVTPTPGPLRTFGVEEELLLVDADSLVPAPAGPEAVRRHAERAAPGPGSGHHVTTELQQEQIEVAGPPVRGLAEQLEAVRRGRELADAAARRVGARAVALAAPVAPQRPHPAPDPRYAWLREHYGLVAREQLTCGLHVHVGVTGAAEGVAVLDRVRVWLPALLALSANSPLWYGRDTGFASFRYQTWARWPTSGPRDVLGSAAAYEEHCAALLRSGVARDRGMLYFDARLSARYPTVEVRIADVCLDAGHTAVLAALVRALVETAARQARSGVPAPDVDTGVLRAWSWQASASGTEGPLVSPVTGAPAPAAEVVGELLAHVGPVLEDQGELAAVEDGTAAVLRGGTGARHQRAAWAVRADPADVVRAALAATHG